MEEWQGPPLTSRGLPRWLECRQVQEYAAVADFVLVQRLNLVLDDHKKEAGKGMCPCHQV